MLRSKVNTVWSGILLHSLANGVFNSYRIVLILQIGNEGNEAKLKQNQNACVNYKLTANI